MNDKKTNQPIKPAPSRYIVWAWYPGGWQLYRIETDWDEAVKAYWEAKTDTTGPVYLTEIKKAPTRKEATNAHHKKPQD